MSKEWKFAIVVTKRSNSNKKFTKNSNSKNHRLIKWIEIAKVGKEEVWILNTNTQRSITTSKNCSKTIMIIVTQKMKRRLIILKERFIIRWALLLISRKGKMKHYFLIVFHTHSHNCITLWKRLNRFLILAITTTRVFYVEHYLA